MKQIINLRMFIVLTIIFSLFSGVGIGEKDYVGMNSPPSMSRGEAITDCNSKYGKDFTLLDLSTYSSAKGWPSDRFYRCVNFYIDAVSVDYLTSKDCINEADFSKIKTKGEACETDNIPPGFVGIISNLECNNIGWEDCNLGGNREFNTIINSLCEEANTYTAGDSPRTSLVCNPVDKERKKTKCSELCRIEKPITEKAEEYLETAQEQIEEASLCGCMYMETPLSARGVYDNFYSDFHEEGSRNDRDMGCLEQYFSSSLDSGSETNMISESCCNGNPFLIEKGATFTSCGPCPFLYSVTDSGKTFEEILIEAQYSSIMADNFYSKLDYFDENTNQIIISEPFIETTYLDTVQLIKVTHPNDVTPMMNGMGKIVTIINPQKVTCTSKSGVDCTNIIQNKDSDYISPHEPLPKSVISKANFGIEAYSTNMDLVNLEDKNTFIDYIELEIPNTDSDKIKLIVDYSYNYDLPMLQLEAVESLKNILPGMYKILEIPYFGELAKKVLEEGGFTKILVQDDNGKWIRYSNDKNSMFASLTQKETVIVMDKSKIKNNKIRLEFTSGIVVFDYIAVDFSDNKITSITYPEMISAKLSDEIDVLSILHDKDNYVRIIPNEKVVIEFNNKITDETSTYFLETNGYYHPGEEEIISQIKLDPESLNLAYKMLMDKDFGIKEIINSLKG
jgi:hypothetical protein